MTEISTTQIEILRVLEKRGQLDEFQIASEANLSLTSVEDALRKLQDHGVLKVSKLQQDPERYSVDRGRLAELARSESAHDRGAPPPVRGGLAR